MSLGQRLKRRSTLTGIAAVLFATGLVLLFVALFRNAAHPGALLWAALTLLALTEALWQVAAEASDDAEDDTASADASR